MTFLGVLACGLVFGRTPLRAQQAPPNPPATNPPIAIPPTSSVPPTRPPPTNSPIAVEGGDDKAWNRGVSVATRQAARDLFLEGNRLFNIPLFAQAADKYTAALARWKHPAFYFNLAIAQLNLSQEVEAHESLKLAMTYGAEPLGAEQFQEAQKQIQDLEHQLGRIRIACRSPGAEVTMDGAPLFTGPSSYDGWVKATNHEITAKKPTFIPQAKRVVVSPGKLATVDLRLRKLVEDRPWAVWKPWAIVSAGVALIAAGGGVHALSARKFNDYDNKFLDLQCANSGGCMENTIRPTLSAELSRARLEQKIAVSGYIAGGSLLAAGAVLLYLNRPHPVEQDAVDSPARGVAIAPNVSTNMLGLQVIVSH